MKGYDINGKPLSQEDLEELKRKEKNLVEISKSPNDVPIYGKKEEKKKYDED